MVEKQFLHRTEMAKIEIRLPKMGESVTEATITNWLKNVGDSVELDEPLVEVATDKVDNELPSEAQGVLIERLFEVDQVAQVGDVIAIISTDGADTPAPAAPAKEETPVQVAESIVANAVQTTQAVAATTNGSGKFYSPLVKSIAQTENISGQELDAIAGTGQGGRVTKKDILSYLENRTSGTVPVTVSETPRVEVPAAKKEAAPAPAASGFLANIKEPVVVPNPGDEIIEMDRMRKLIAEHMIMSTHVSPHVTSYVEADVTEIVNWRNKVKDVYKKREGENITFTPIFMEAIVKAIKDFPMINVSVSGTKIIKRKDINLGMATALPSGNLIVPVIKNADQLNLNGLTKAVNALANNAYGANFSYNEAMLTGQGWNGRIKAYSLVAGLGAFMLAAVSKPISKVMERYILPKPGEGPTPEQQRSGRFDLRFIGKSDAGQSLRVKVTGDRDPGYGSTGKMLGQAALSLVLDHQKDGKKTGRNGGFWTPATMFDERYIERLKQHAGIGFEVI